jgi:hypothetical protein
MSHNPQSLARGTKMLRTAMGADIGRFLVEPDVVEIMLNPDGKLWIDRLGGGLKIRAYSSLLLTVNASSGWSPIMLALKSILHRPGSQPSYRKAGSGLRG